MLTAFVPHFVRDHFSVRISDIDDSSFTGTNSGDAVTFANMDAGWPRADRLLIALIHSRDGTDDATFSIACTIGGVSASQIAASGVAAGGSTSFVAIFAAVVPSGLTVDVSPTVTGFSGTFDAWGCTLIRATGLASTTALDSDGLASSASVININTAGAKFAVAVCGELGTDISAATPYSSSGGSVLTLGHRMTYGLAFLDTNPSGAATDYSIVGNSSGFPNTIAAACWG